MKRSEINQAIKNALEILERNSMKLPNFAYWNRQQWEEHKGETDDLKKIMLGWDVTDFGSGDFRHVGAVLFTLRNGLLGDDRYGTPYAEKLMVLKSVDRQSLPMHCHLQKTEDIINRGGGVLEIKLYGSKEDGTLDPDSPVKVRMDGIMRTVNPGEILAIEKGDSITLTPGIYHSFWVKEGRGDLVAGEVSSVNDDKTDNIFVEKRPRFSEIVEDEPAEYILCNEYEMMI